MKKVKMPKRPRPTASNEVKKRYLDRLRDAKKHNDAVEREKAEGRRLNDQITKAIAGFRK